MKNKKKLNCIVGINIALLIVCLISYGCMGESNITWDSTVDPPSNPAPTTPTFSSPKQATEDSNSYAEATDETNVLQLTPQQKFSAIQRRVRELEKKSLHAPPSLDSTTRELQREVDQLKGESRANSNLITIMPLLVAIVVILIVIAAVLYIRYARVYWIKEVDPKQPEKISEKDKGNSE